MGAAAAPRLRVAAAKADEGLLFPLAGLITLMAAGLFPYHGKITPQRDALIDTITADLSASLGSACNAAGLASPQEAHVLLARK